MTAVLKIIAVASAGAAAAVGVRMCATEPLAKARPSVLFIAVDDLRPELGCYGAHYAQSPRIDGFARTATLFESHFVQAPSCGPSRFALLTGKSAASTGTLPNEAFYRGPAQLDPGPSEHPRTLPEVFRRGGYRTAQIGKISHTPDGRVFAYSGEGDGRPELPGAWDELATPYGPWNRGWGAFFAYAGGAHREDGSTEAVRSQFVAQRDVDLPDGLLAEAAAAKLAELGKRDEPFFLGVGFYKPHLPFVAPAEDRAALEDVEIPTPAVRALWPAPYTHRSGEFTRYRSSDEGPLPAGAEEMQRVLRDYLACVRYVDRQVGVVLDALEQAGLAESTIVVLWADHGWHLGESGMFGKHTVLERSLRSPLLVRAPGVSRAGQRVDALAATIDLYPTLIELCDLGAHDTAPPGEGVSLRPLLDGTEDSVRGACAAWYGNAVTLRTSTHRLLATRKGGDWSNVQLFAVNGAPDPTPADAVDDAQLTTELLDELGRLERQAR